MKKTSKENFHHLYKFWNKKTKKMLFDGASISLFGIWSNGEAAGGARDPGAEVDPMWELRGQWKDLIPLQCTGMEDKDGKLIFNGDIIKNKITEHSASFWGEIAYETGYKMGLCVVEWGSHGWHGAGLAYWKKEGEVIGNIFENHELLKND